LTVHRLVRRARLTGLSDKGDICGLLFDGAKSVRACQAFLEWLREQGGECTRREFSQFTRNLQEGKIYLRQGFKDLIEKHAVDIVGPDPCDVGGIAELKWVAEFADLHGILVAPHGVGDGLIGLAALVQVAATLPKNYIAFEYPVGRPEWWYDIVEGLPDPIVKDGLIEVPDRPGMGVELNEKAARKHLPEGDDFFD